MEFFAARLESNQDLGGGYALLGLSGCDALEGARPGQFVMLRGAWGRDPILPRAYSILSAEGGAAEFLVRRVGRGSTLLAQMHPGGVLTVLGPLGNAFPLPQPGLVDLLVAGGCGLPPLHLAARRAATQGQAGQVELLVGARGAAELAPTLLDRLGGAGVKVRTITEDGSSGEKGLVTDLLRRRLEQLPDARVMACGPTGMLRGVRELARRCGARCLLSLEAEMACGLGACLGCAVEARDRAYLHVCKDGPVFEAEEVWP